MMLVSKFTVSKNKISKNSRKIKLFNMIFSYQTLITYNIFIMSIWKNPVKLYTFFIADYILILMKAIILIYNNYQAISL